jgi:hypothetical protein
MDFSVVVKKELVCGEGVLGWEYAALYSKIASREFFYFILCFLRRIIVLLIPMLYLYSKSSANE